MVVAGAVVMVGLVVAVGPAGGGQEGGGSGLGIDPVTLLQWREACRLVDDHEAAIWPGYRLAGIPALILNPKVAEVLIGHPRPPERFFRFEGPSPLGEQPLFVRRGETTFPSGVDTSTPLGGVTTLVVTDRGARGASDDAWNLAVMVHEGFHAWAGDHLKSPPAAELDLLEWPDLDATVNAHLELEGRALVAALATVEDGARDELEEHALLFLAERARRRALMPAAAIRYEDHNELNEGLASYVEWRAYELWAEHGVAEHGVGAVRPAAFRARADGMVNMLSHSARGTLSINGSAFGPGTVRRRGYFFGAAIGKLLDRLDPDGSAAWKQEVAAGRTLTELLLAALGDPAAAELAERADAFERDEGFAALVATKETLVAAGRREREQRIAAVLEGAGTLLVIDVAALAPRGALLPSNWNPFGVLRVDDHRRLFSQSATRFEVGGARVEAAVDAAVIVDEATREILVRSPIDATTLAAALTPWNGRYGDAAITIEAASATLAETGVGRLRLVLRATP